MQALCHDEAKFRVLLRADKWLSHKANVKRNLLVKNHFDKRASVDVSGETRQNVISVQHKCVFLSQLGWLGKAPLCFKGSVLVTVLSIYSVQLIGFLLKVIYFFDLLFHKMSKFLWLGKWTINLLWLYWMYLLEHCLLSMYRKVGGLVPASCILRVDVLVSLSDTLSLKLPLMLCKFCVNG